MALQSAETGVLGKYRLIRRLATGGMAEIYLAVQQGPHGFEKVVVVKVILADLGANDDFVHMFLDEARIAANLEHNNVVRVYDFGEVDGRYYLAMEHLPGEDLHSILQMLRRARRWLPIGLACDIVMGAAAGLHYAHQQCDGRGRPLNIVHRDVTPSNLIVTYHGTVKLLDFGIARAESNITKTEAGAFKGKVAYVSPEQALGEPVDCRSDVFSLGVVLYEALTMVRPFKRESELATLKAVVSEPVPRPSTLRYDLPPELDAIVERAMSRDVSARYQTAAELGEALEQLIVSQGYPRGERALAELLGGLFDEERRLGKLRVSQLSSAGGSPLLNTPSQLNALPEDMAAVRGLATPLTPKPTVSIPVIFEPEAGDEKPELHRPPMLRWLAIGTVALAVSAGAAARFLWPTTRTEAVATAHVAEAVRDAVGAEHTAAAAEPATPPAGRPTPQVEPQRNDAPEASPPRPTDAAAEAPPPPVAEAAKPRAPRGQLTLDSAPWSEVFLKGRKLGDTPLVDYSLPAGVHTLTLVNEARGLRQVIEVEVMPGKTTVLRLKL